MKALIILPKGKSDINDYIKTFTKEKYDKILKSLVNKKVIFSLPKFEIQFKVELKETFISLGMVDPFSNDPVYSKFKNNQSVVVYDQGSIVGAYD